jgi:hypothetical protein
MVISTDTTLVALTAFAVHTMPAPPARQRCPLLCGGRSIKRRPAALKLFAPQLRRQSRYLTREQQAVLAVGRRFRQQVLRLLDLFSQVALTQPACRADRVCPDLRFGLRRLALRLSLQGIIVA